MRCPPRPRGRNREIVPCMRTQYLPREANLHIQMPVIETSRLIIRHFQPDDLEAAHRLMRDLGDDSTTLEERRAWLAWVSATPEQLGRLFQPPYGDRAAVRREDGRLIGSCGLVP